MSGKKGVIKFFCVLMLSFLVVCFDRIYQIQYQSICSESGLKPIWEYEKNTIYVGTGDGDNEKETRYFLDEKNAWVLYDLFMKYDCVGPAGAM